MRYLADTALVDRLCAERLEREAEAIRAEGWKWVQIMPDMSYEALRGYGRREGRPQPLSPKQTKALVEVETARETLAAKEKLTDEEFLKLEALTAQAELLAEPCMGWSNRQKKRCGAFVGITDDGYLSVVRGLIAPQDMKGAKAEDSSHAEHDGTPSQADPQEAGLSKTFAR